MRSLLRRSATSSSRAAGSTGSTGSTGRGGSLGERLRRAVARPLRRPVDRVARGLVVTYAPRPDGRPDPGEVVWAWVTYEEDPRQGKDRPVLLVARDRKRLYGLMLTSQDHDRDAAQEARWGRYWMDVGSGAWDRQRRPSEVRLDRLIEIEETSVRREGAALDRARFDAVVTEARRFHRLL
ncbi:type II toxin-antitoxin system PemK/MazF family toxin [Nocardioides sp. GY 10127]|uniref:type II toxin-antitoxin system PemK/MazF family toxin n=1 Tax=Nocardioides sp. GY 10127 TaxID=2569762 RepID=UPI0010A8A761|nr:type II toxin-antitoxin system PemK/MazF family toxin [Nocardioides sp. GY 10127]TIC84390.1 type II toxin-antitoxin system PemK/MazF family toxin [Nocardioides sp. GY 10127]